MKKILKSTLYTLLIAGSYTFIQGMVEGTMHEGKSGIQEAPKIDPRIEAEKNARHQQAVIEQTRLEQQATAQQRSTATGKEEMSPGEIKYKNDIKTQTPEALKNQYENTIEILEKDEKSGKLTTTKGKELLNDTKVALDILEYELDQKQKSNIGLNGSFDFSQSNNAIIKTGFTEGANKINLFEDSGEPEIITPEDYNTYKKSHEEILDIEEYNRLEESTERTFKQNPKTAAEQVFKAIDPENIMPESDRVEFIEEFEKGPEKGQTWSEWFKSIYQKMVNAFNKAFKIKTSTKSSGKLSEPFPTKPLEPTTKNIEISDDQLDILYKDLETKANDALYTGKKLSPDQQEMLNFLRERDNAQGQ